MQTFQNIKMKDTRRNVLDEQSYYKITTLSNFLVTY